MSRRAVLAVLIFLILGLASCEDLSQVLPKEHSNTQDAPTTKESLIKEGPDSKADDSHIQTDQEEMEGFQERPLMEEPLFSQEIQVQDMELGESGDGMKGDEEDEDEEVGVVESEKLEKSKEDSKAQDSTYEDMSSVEEVNIDPRQQAIVQDPETPITEKKPNIVIMIADDIGMGDLGCFGNTTMKTPNLDKMAKDGVKLTQNIAAASVCTPSRAALLTGRYPVRTGMAPSNVVRVNIFVSSTGGLPSEEITLAEIAKDQGYSTAWIGKWHMGVHCGKKDFCHHPNKQGFDHFYGLPMTNLKDFGDDDSTVTKSRVPYIDYYLVIAAVLGTLTAIIFRKQLGLVFTLILIFVSISVPLLTYWIYNNMTILNAVMMRNMDIIEQPIRLHNRLAARVANEATEFIDKQAENDKPFVLVVGWVQAHTSLHTSPEFKGVSVHGEYGDNVEEMDWSVGQVLKALKRNNLDDNTLVYFTSDNGAHNEETGPDGKSRHGGWNGIYKGGKAMGGMEGGIRVPGIARFTGKIPAGRVINQAVSMMDLYTTSAGLIGANVPTDRVIDGVDVWPLLKGDNEKPAHEYLFHYCGVSLQAARYSPDDGTGNIWKVHFATPNWFADTENCQFICGCYGGSVTWHDPPLLYNLRTDPSEKTKLDTADATHAPIVAKIKKAVAEHKAGVKDTEDQMSPLKILPYPPLQPCCGDGSFPNCECAEPDFPAPSGD